MQFIDIIIDTEGVAIVMELVNLGNVGDHRLDGHQQMLLGQQMLDAIGYLHRIGAVHRDVKPTNILLGSLDPLISLLSDFSVAAMRTSGLTTFCGTPKYAAPEIFKRSYGKEVDVYSLGVTMLDIINPLPDQQPSMSHDGWVTYLRATAAGLRKTRNSLVFEWIWRMIDPDPGSRLSVLDALAQSYLISPVQSSAQRPPSQNHSAVAGPSQPRQLTPDLVDPEWGRYPDFTSLAQPYDPSLPDTEGIGIEPRTIHELHF